MGSKRLQTAARPWPVHKGYGRWKIMTGIDSSCGCKRTGSSLSSVDDCFDLSPLPPELWCTARTVISSDIVGGYFWNTHMTWKYFLGIMFVCTGISGWLNGLTCIFLVEGMDNLSWWTLIGWRMTEAGNIKFIVCSVECACRSTCIYVEGSRRTYQSYLDQISSKQW